jgi:hypothetical protein
MESIIRPSDKPIVKVLESCEIVFTSRDPNVEPLHVLKSTTPEGRILVRFTPTDEQRLAILHGTDIYLSLLTFGQPLPPIMLFTSEELDEAQVVEIMQLVPKV